MPIGYEPSETPRKTKTFLCTLATLSPQGNSSSAPGSSRAKARTFSQRASADLAGGRPAGNESAMTYLPVLAGPLAPACTVHASLGHRQQRGGRAEG